MPEDCDERVRRGSRSPCRRGAFAEPRGPESGRGRRRPVPLRRRISVTSTAIDLEDLFGGMFGQAARAGRFAGADQEAELELTVEEAYRGGRRQITLGGPDGPRSYEVNIPPGVIDGQRIRLAGEGGQGSGDGPAGDLYLVVRIVPHPRFRVAGRDIYVDLPVTPWEAALGATVPVPDPRRRGEGQGAGRARRAGGGCGCAARACPTRAAPPATSTPRSRSWCRRSSRSGRRELFEELAAASTFDPRRAPMSAHPCGRRPSTSARRRYPLVRPCPAQPGRPRPPPGLHPDLVRRFVALGLLRRRTRTPAGELWFDPAAPATVARIQRLRTGLGLNYAALGLVLDLLDRIASSKLRYGAADAGPMPKE